MFTELTKKLDSFLEMGIPGYDCVVYHKGECVYRHQNGYSDRENKVLMNGKELYNIYSCSKVITCTAALMLYEKGLYKLEDKLADYMPEFEAMYVNTENGLKRAENSITIKDLFCMTAGFSYNLNSPMIQKCKEETNGKCQTRELMKYLAKEPLLFEPGERWEYSLCHDVLAAFVEVVSGMRFGEYLKENIFKPLGMENTTYLLDENQLDTISPQYRFNPKTNKTDICAKTIVYKLGTEYESGGAGCVTTVDDYMKFLEGLRTEKLISGKTLELMTQNQLTDKQAESYWVENSGYGLGVYCSTNGEHSAFGWGGAAGAYPLIDRKNKLTFFYVQHVLNTDCDARNIPMRNFFINKLTQLCEEKL